MPNRNTRMHYVIELNLDNFELVFWLFLIPLGKKYKFLERADKVQYWRDVLLFSFFFVFASLLFSLFNLGSAIFLFTFGIIILSATVWIFKWRKYCNSVSLKKVKE